MSMKNSEKEGADHRRRMKWRYGDNGVKWGGLHAPVVRKKKDEFALQEHATRTASSNSSASDF
jgi:hypothetical protein